MSILIPDLASGVESPPSFFEGPSSLAKVLRALEIRNTSSETLAETLSFSDYKISSHGSRRFCPALDPWGFRPDPAGRTPGTLFDSMGCLVPTRAGGPALRCRFVQSFKPLL